MQKPSQKLGFNKINQIPVVMEIPPKNITLRPNLSEINPPRYAPIIFEFNVKKSNLPFQSKLQNHINLIVLVKDPSDFQVPFEEFKKNTLLLE
jgi:hypothetical protein